MMIYQVETLKHINEKAISKTIYMDTDYQVAKENAIKNKVENTSVWLYTWEIGSAEYKDIEEI